MQLTTSNDKKDTLSQDKGSLAEGNLREIMETQLEHATTEDLDDAQLRANGHEAVMKRQFKWISALGLGFSITNSWVGYLVSFSYSLCGFGLTSTT